MNSLATFETLSVLCHACHEHHFAKNTTQVQAKVCPKCVYDPNHKRKRDRRVVVENSNQCFYLLSHDNDMDPFYVHDTVLIRARKWRTTQNLQDISDMALRSMIETEFRALPELTLVEKCMISLAVPIMNTHIGILNGAMGTIKDFVWNTGQHPETHLPKAIVVEFDDYMGPPFFTEPERRKWVPLTPRVSEATSKDYLTRYQGIALTLASSFTCHKAQGITNKVGAIVDLGIAEISAGTTYVALSRTMELQRLCILGNPSTSRLTTPHADVRARKAEQKRLRKCADDYKTKFPVILFGIEDDV